MVWYTGVFDPARRWVLLVRHERVWLGPSPTLAILMGKDRNAPNAAIAASHQMLLQMDNATLGRTLCSEALWQSLAQVRGPQVRVLEPFALQRAPPQSAFTISYRSLIASA